MATEVVTLNAKKHSKEIRVNWNLRGVDYIFCPFYNPDCLKRTILGIYFCRTGTCADFVHLLCLGNQVANCRYKRLYTWAALKLYLLILH